MRAADALKPGSEPTRSPALFCVDALRGRTHVRITLSPLLSGVFLRTPCTKFEPDPDPNPDPESNSAEAFGSSSDLDAEERAAAVVALKT